MEPLTNTIAPLWGTHKLTFALLGLGALLLLASRVAAARSARMFKAEHGCEPPQRRYPHKDPILATDLILSNLQAFKENRLLSTSVDRFKEYGNTYVLRVVLGKWITFTIDPDNIKTVLSVNFKDYSLGLRQDYMGPLLGRGIFVADGDDWAHSRAMLRPNFVRDQVADLDMADEHIQHLLKAIPRGTVFDLQKLFHQFTLDSATDFLLGQSTNILSGGGAEAQLFSDAFDFALKDIAYQLRLGPFRHFQWSRKKADAAYDVCRTYVDRFVDKAMDFRKSASGGEEKGRNYFLQSLASSNASPKSIRDEVLNILLAGRDTTASLLSSLFFVLARRPDIWTKLRDEVDTLGGKRPSYEQLRSLTYAKYCLNETLRLYPPVPINGRLAIRETVLPHGGGPNGDKPLHVAKGSTVVYHTYSMHRRKDFYGEDAEEFRPERWEHLRPSWEYLPFNGGPRICLGQQYALTEALLVVVRMLQEFTTIESRDTRPWTEELSLTVSLNNGVLVSLS